MIAANDGVITSEQARECGLTAKQILGRCQRGTWHRLAHGVYLSAEHNLTGQAQLRAMAHRFSGVVDRTSAAWWHGWTDVLDPTLTLSVPRSVTMKRATGLPWPADVRQRTSPAEDTEVLRGLPVTKGPLTALLAAGWIDTEEIRVDGRSSGRAAALLDRILQTGQVTVKSLTAAMNRNPRIQGMVEARAMLAVAATDSESEAERLFVVLLESEQISGWQQQVRFHHWRLDFAWPSERLAVEIDGWAFHRDQRRHDSGARKTSALSAEHWIVLHYTWHQLRYDAETCLRQLAGALADRRELLG